MPRGLLEAVLRTPLGPVRMMTTHLEWSSSVLRGRQVEAIRQIHELSCSHVARPSKPGKGTYALQLGTRSAILTGDSNMLPSEAESLMKQPFASDTPSLVDAWESLNPGIAHPPSMSVHDPSDGAPRLRARHVRACAAAAFRGLRPDEPKLRSSTGRGRAHLIAIERLKTSEMSWTETSKKL